LSAAQGRRDCPSAAQGWRDGSTDAAQGGLSEEQTIDYQGNLSVWMKPKK